MLHLSEAQTTSAVGSTQDEFLLRSPQGQDLLLIAMHLQKMADMAASKLTVSITSVGGHCLERRAREDESMSLKS